MAELVVNSKNLNKEQLLQLLSDSGVKINEYAKLIFDSPEYEFINKPDSITVVERSLFELGLKEGGTFSDIERAMKDNRLDYCPLAFAPYIRLAYNRQETSHLKTQNQHPPDSLLIFSKPIIRSDDFPKGFYIRNIDGTLWLRGYTCTEDYRWNAADRIILEKNSK